MELKDSREANYFRAERRIQPLVERPFLSEQVVEVQRYQMEGRPLGKCF